MKRQQSLRFLLLSTLLCFSINIFSQSKADKLFDKALVHYHSSEHKKAIKLISKAIALDSTISRAHILLANIHEENEDINNAIKSYDRAFEFYHPSFIESYIHNLELKLNNHKYESLIDQSFELLNQGNIEDKFVSRINRYRDLAEFRSNAIANPVDFEYEELDNTINTDADEYIDAFYTDNDQLLFTRKSRSATKTHKGNYKEHLYLADLKDTTDEKSVKEFLNKEIYQRIGAASVSLNDRYLVFTACYRNDGYGNCDLYYIDLWKKPFIAKNMGSKINSEYWESQPFFSPDGKYLYFSSKRPSGFGGSDLWRCRLDDNGNWQPAKNLGRSVNTEKDEMSLFIHPNNQDVYFSSNGHIGMGGFDIFKANLKGNKITEIQNLGYPINTETDQTNFILSDDGSTAFISSVMNDRKDLNIYSFNPHTKPHINLVTNHLVYFSDQDNDDPILVNKSEIELRNEHQLSINNKLIPLQDPAFFKLISTENEQQIISVNRPGYLYRSLVLNSRHKSGDTINIKLEKLEVGSIINLENVLFNTDQYEIRVEGLPTLENLIDFLNNNSSVKVEIAGHTDDIGETSYNNSLSKKRANAVYNYLITNGISANRLSAKGYGESQPILPNDSDENRAKNRRTEIRIIAI